jgi:hypothetical protein
VRRPIESIAKNISDFEETGDLDMKSFIAAALLSAAMLVPQLANAAGGITLSGLRADTAVETVQYGGYCERLRRACEFKYERGQAGEGNCSRYRAECTGRAAYCERLRRACVYKDYRGEAGMGNCSRYRAECGR